MEYQYIEYKRKADRETLSDDKYLNEIRLHLMDIINNLKKSDTWKIQSTIGINFISSKDNNEERVMHSKSDDTLIMINDDVNHLLKNVKLDWKNY